MALSFGVLPLLFTVVMTLPMLNQVSAASLAGRGSGHTVRSTNDTSSGDDAPAPTQRFHEQRVDHFDWQNTATYKQRYFVNDTFWVPGSDAPVFLCVGGEGLPLDASVVRSSVHCNDAVELLPKVNGLMFALEHRYYGESVPTEDLSAKNMQYLSSKQALADIVAFHGYVSKKYNLTSANKWVAFGGSYPGMLAGWTRQLYPHLFHAAVASSAPTRAQLNYKKYNDVVGDVLGEPIVGGSRKCRQLVMDGHARIAELLKKEEGRVELAVKFNVCRGAEGLETMEERQNFAGYGVIPLNFQVNDPACTEEACNIEKTCDLLLKKPNEDPVDALARVNAQLRKTNDEGCWNTTTDLWYLDTNKTNGDRSWLYQTCTEFAFFQTCDEGTSCPFAQGYLPLDIFIDQCKEAFNIGREQIQRAVHYSNLFYGADKPASSRIFYVSGSVDPWYPLSVVESPDPENLPTWWAEGASHHFWTHPSLPTDQPSVVKARHQIWKQVLEWLNE